MTDKPKSLTVNLATGKSHLEDIPDETIEKMKAEAQQAENERLKQEQARQAAIEKLAAIGLTPEDLTALGISV